MGHPSDQDLDLSVAAMLRVGVTLSAFVVLLGGCLLLAHSGRSVPHFYQFRPGNRALTTLTGILRGAINRSPENIIQLGLLLLIATPVARVVLCVVGFARQRSLLYVAISALVLAILLYSLFRNG